MALRVLLADESPTIKKVFQLSLQDYGVEVKSVNVGGDVLEVASQFKPDIVFADVLLQQMSGYQVSSEIKVDNDLKEIPVVLMWSGFMDIDEDKFQASHADAKLEKPFDIENLRGLIQQLVPKVQTQNLSEFLEFPDLPEFEEKSKPSPPVKSEPKKSEISKSEQKPVSMPTPSQEDLLQTTFKKEIQETNKAEENSNWNMESFETVDLSHQLPPRIDDQVQKEDESFLSEADEDSDWIQGNIESFKLNVNINDNTNVEEEEVPIESFVSESVVDAATKASSLIPPIPDKKIDIQKDYDDLEIESPNDDMNNLSLDISNLPQLSEERLSELIRIQSREIVEKVVWQVVPELATQIIEREIKRLLEEQNNLR